MICAVCCGTGREVTIDCPSDCVHLLAARRYEHDHSEPLPADQLPYPDIHIPSGKIPEHEEALIVLAQALAQAGVETRATDDEALTALAAMVETYRTLQTGIFYERTPEGAIARQLYARIAKALDEYRAAEAERFGFSRLKEGDVIALLVFLLRVGKQETNGRPRSRAFLDFLRSTLPGEKAGMEPSRIITP